MSASISAATAFLDALKHKDLSQAPLADTVSYQGPLSGETIRGREHVARFLSVYVPIVQDIHILRHIADADFVATIWQADTSFGKISLVYIFRVELDKIVQIQAFYDPRGFLERLGASG